MAKAATLDADLVNGLKDAKSKRCYFALVLKGSNDGGLIVSKTKVQPTEIADAKKKSGGTTVVAGFCSYKDGTFVFETGKDAPTTADQAVKNIAKRDAGLAVKAEFRLSNDPELLAEQGDKSTGKIGTQPQNSADLMARLNGLKSEIKAAMSGPNGARIQPLVAAMTKLIANEKLDDAAKGLAELEKLVKGAKIDGPAQKDMAAQKDGLETALAAWTTARLAALGQLAKLAAAIKTSGHPKAAEGFQLIELIIKKNVTQRPATANQVKELRHYIETEEVFVDAEKPNPFKLAVKVRQPLIDALTELQKHVV